MTGLMGVICMLTGLLLHVWINDSDPFRQVFLWLQRLAELLFFLGIAIIFVWALMAALG